MKKVVTAIGAVALGIALFGTSANANPPVIARPIAPAPTVKSAPPSPHPPGTIGYGVKGGGMTYHAFAPATRIPCTNNSFGGDPAPGQKKACYADDGTMLADEGGFANVPGPACPMVPVKFVSLTGVATERSFCIGRQVRCSNEVFGKDPAVGIVKHCTMAEKTVASEHNTFSTGAGEACLCNGKTLDELRSIWLTIENTSQY